MANEVCVLHRGRLIFISSRSSQFVYIASECNQASLSPNADIKLKDWEIKFFERKKRKKDYRDKKCDCPFYIAVGSYVFQLDFLPSVP